MEALLENYTKNQDTVVDRTDPTIDGAASHVVPQHCMFTKTALDPLFHAGFCILFVLEPQNLVSHETAGPSWVLLDPEKKLVLHES